MRVTFSMRVNCMWILEQVKQLDLGQALQMQTSPVGPPQRNSLLKHFFLK